MVATKHLETIRLIKEKDDPTLADIIRKNLEVAVHLYEKLGFHKIQKQREVQHSTMNLFFMKEL